MRTAKGVVRRLLVSGLLCLALWAAGQTSFGQGVPQRFEKSHSRLTTNPRVLIRGLTLFLVSLGWRRLFQTQQNT